MDHWEKKLDQSFGETPRGPMDEFERIMNRVKTERVLGSAEQSPRVWPILLCAASLSLGILVSWFIQPQTHSSEAEVASILSVDMNSTYDESLEVLQTLADQVN